MSAMLEYSEINSPIHKLTGATKLICLVIWALASMVTYDTRILVVMVICSIAIFKISKVEFKTVSFVFYLILVFLLINNIAIFLFSPLEGTYIYGSRTDLFHIAGPYTVTTEQLFYQLNITLKYFAIIPMALLFIVATNPSEFAASLNKIGVNYKIAYSVAIALRYIPDVQRDYHTISLAQQARGLEMSSKAKLMNRIKNIVTILTPLIFTTMDRIELITNAMELRGFGKGKKRSWYSFKPLQTKDWISMFICLLIFLFMLYIRIFVNKSMFYNPFI